MACLDLERHTPDRKSDHGVALLRPRDRTALAPEMEEAAASYTARAAEKLRRQHLATAHVMAFIETNRFTPGERQYFASKPVHLKVATSDTTKLITTALTGLRAIWRNHYRYKKAGVLLLDLHPASAVRESLFDTRDSARRTRLMRAIDQINRDQRSATPSASPPPA